MDLANLCQIIQERLFDIPSHPRSLLDDLEVCIGGIDSVASENPSAAEISLSKEMIIAVGRYLGNEERTKALVLSTPVSDGIFGEQLSEQLVRHGRCTLAYADLCASFLLLLFFFFLLLIPFVLLEICMECFISFWAPSSQS